MSDLPRSLTKNERMSESLIFFERIAHSFIFGQKTSDLLGNQMSEFPAMEKMDNGMNCHTQKLLNPGLRIRLNSDCIVQIVN